MARKPSKASQAVAFEMDIPEIAQDPLGVLSANALVFAAEVLKRAMANDGLASQTLINLAGGLDLVALRPATDEERAVLPAGIERIVEGPSEALLEAVQALTIETPTGAA